MRNYRFILGFLVVVFFTGQLFSQQGKVYETLSLKSSKLQSERNFAIYLPADYDSSDRTYPVLYLLHGSGDDQTGWVQFGEVAYAADLAIKNGRATPMIIVMPDANTGLKGYFNDIEGNWNYEDFFFEELIPHIESNYRVKGQKQFRAVAGLSMGGGGALIYALHRPDYFSSSAPLSAYIGPASIEDLASYVHRDGTKKYSSQKLEAYFNQHNALALIKNQSKESISSVNWYIDCGDDDYLYEGNSLVHIALKKKEVSHEYRVRDGEHNWTYWRASLPAVLEFVSHAFHQY